MCLGRGNGGRETMGKDLGCFEWGADVSGKGGCANWLFGLEGARDGLCV